MEILNLEQGTEGWHEVRADHFTASEAPAMMGESKLVTRDELIAAKYGADKDVSDYVQKNLYDKGHENEALARPVAEKIIDDDLFPVTGRALIEGLPLLASYDGITMAEDVCFEHKSLNDDLRFILAHDDMQLPMMYRIQMEQQLMISGAEKCLFMASDGTEANAMHRWYYPDLELREAIIKGWKQFKEDLKDYVPTEKTAAPKGKTVEELPALIVNVSGQVATTNIDEFKATAIEFIENINTDLQTDQDFADAEKMAKFCKKAEDQIKQVKQASVDQMADVSKVFKTMDFIAEELRQKRLSLEKDVVNKKQEKKNGIIHAAKTALDEYISTLNAEFNRPYVHGIQDNFAAVIKGKKTIDSVQSSVNDELARMKIEVNDLAAIIRKNLKVLNDQAAEYKSLFNDIEYVIQKDPEDFANLVFSRIEAHMIEREAQEKAKQAEAEKAAETVKEPLAEATNTQSPQTEAPPAFSDDQLISFYMDSLRLAIDNSPSVSDKKLEKLVIRIQKKLLKAVDELEEKSAAQDKAA